MRTLSYTLFETALGWMGVAWSAAGIVAVQTPDRDCDATLRRLLRKIPGAEAVETTALPDMAHEAVATLKAYAAGEAANLDAIPLDLSGIEPFNLDIYRVARALAFGETVTYGELARRAGHAGLARETGQALGANPVPIIVPCHRIVAAGGKLGGFSAPGGPRTKERLLALEGVKVGPSPPTQTALPF